jgi:hypothetical protein
MPDAAVSGCGGPGISVKLRDSQAKFGMRVSIESKDRPLPSLPDGFGIEGEGLLISELDL